MSLISISANSQGGSFDLPASQDTNLPGLVNSSDQPITVAITAIGQWSLSNPNSPSSDPKIAKYKIQVDGDGYGPNADHKWKYPALNPGALVGQINDTQGNLKSTVSGKQQNFELQPGETVFFIINDDPRYFTNNVGKQTITYSITPKTKPPQSTQKGKIVVNSDEWTLGNVGFQRSPDAAIFAINVAKYFVGERKGKFHALSSNFGLVQSSLEQTMTTAGHTWTKGMNITIDLPTLSQYDGIFVGGDLVDNKVLIQYVKNGGKVYLCAGTGWGGPQAEADRWNTFLVEFGLKFAGAYNGIEGNFSPNQSHPLFTGVKSLYFNNGNSITDLKPESPLNQIVQTHSNGQGLIATAEFDPTEPIGIIDLYNTGVDNARNVLGDSVADPHYTLTTSPAGAVTPAVTTPGTGWPGGWVANTTTSRWIGPNTPSATGPIGEYTYRTTFTLPNFSKALIVGELSTDDQVTDILINGISAGNPKLLGSWTTVSQFSISRGFVVGINTIEFKVSNSGGGPTGLRVHSITGTYTPGFTIADLYNTGVDNARNLLGDSVADSHYTLTSSPAGTVTPAVTTPNSALSPINWLANTTTSRWIGPNSASANGPVGDYTYKTTFTLPSFSTASIVGELSVDDRIIDILINGVSAGNPTPLGNWTTISKFSISTGFLVGINTLEFKVNSIGGPTGLRVDKIVGSYTAGFTKEQVLSQKWVQVPNSGSVIGITVLPNGTILGIGTDNLLYTRATLNSNWVQVPNSGAVIGITVLPNGTILGIGTDKLLYTRATLNSNWVQVPNSGSVIGVTVLPNGTILGIGTDNLLYTRANLNSNWVQVPGSGSVIGITVFQNGTILGIGTDKLLYTRANLNSNWVQVPNSCCVIGVTIMPNGTILGIGTDKLLWTKSI
ncbi:MAG: hypothetical protein HEQ10_14375 [Dolichospermum sp. DEX182a]|nr:hypothetical protein [Dolichospermum sp. DEX182a]QSV63973.1 MAG: hypothetical protein HEQ26_15620 [Dolichospermum sp. DL01]